MALIEAEEKKETVLKGVDEKVWLKPEMNEAQFKVRLQSIWEYCVQVRRSYKVLNWENSYQVFAEVIQATFFDGNGYAIPCFGVYINEQPQKQMINSVMKVPNKLTGKFSYLPSTDFAKDIVMENFTKSLYMNLNDWENYLKNKRKEMGQQIPEFTEQINENETGKKELAKPYERQIDELLKDTE